MSNESLAALLKNKYFHQKILAKSIVITIALLLMTSFLHSALAQVQPMRYNSKGNEVLINFIEYDPMNLCPYKDFYLYAADTMWKIAPEGPNKPVPGHMGWLFIYEDDCQDWIEGYAELMDFTIEAEQGTLASASLKGTATIEYQKDAWCCIDLPPYGYYCYSCPEYWYDDVTMDIALVGSGEINRQNLGDRIIMPNFKLHVNQNGLFRPSSASITIKGAYTDIQKEIVYQPPPNPSYPFDPFIEITESAQIGRINIGNISILRP